MLCAIDRSALWDNRTALLDDCSLTPTSTITLHDQQTQTWSSALNNRQMAVARDDRLHCIDLQ